MNRQRISLYIIMLFFAGLFSCHKPSPQLPSNKGSNVDESVASLLQINSELTVREDSLLAEFVKTQKDKFEKNELGFWYKVHTVSTGDLLKDKETCIIEYELSLLDGRVVEKNKLKVTLGKKQIVTGLEEGLKLLHRGENATFIIPWYLGYGRKGLESVVPPFTSLIYNVSLIK